MNDNFVLFKTLNVDFFKSLSSFSKKGKNWPLFQGNEISESFLKIFFKIITWSKLPEKKIFSQKLSFYIF